MTFYISKQNINKKTKTLQGMNVLMQADIKVRQPAKYTNNGEAIPMCQPAQRGYTQNMTTIITN